MNKKMIAPTVCALVVIICIIGYLSLFTMIPNIVVIGFAVLIGIFVIGAIFYVLMQRYKEIKGGEEDDISKY